MNTCTRLLILLAVVLGGCSRTGRPATAASASRFSQLLVAELKLLGSIEELVNSLSGSGNVYSAHTSYVLDPEAFRADQLQGVAIAAMKKWDEDGQYAQAGKGGGDDCFRMHYGDGRTQAFVNVLAYPYRSGRGDRTRVDIFIGVVE